MASARAKAELAIQAANKAQSDADKARTKAREYAPDLFQPQQLTGNDNLIWLQGRPVGCGTEW